MTKTSTVLLTIFTIVAPVLQASADPTPLPPESKNCVTVMGQKSCVIAAPPPDSCSPCWFGCYKNQCNGQPGRPSGDWRLAAETLGAVDCHLDDRSEDSGTCDLVDGTWSWSCDGAACEDSNGMIWNRYQPKPDAQGIAAASAAVMTLAREQWDAWSAGDFDPDTRRVCTKDGSICGVCLVGLWPPEIACVVATPWGACGASCAVDGCMAECS